MFIKVDVLSNSKRFAEIGEKLLRAELVNQLGENGTGSSFKYPINSKDRRDEYTYITASDSVAAIQAAIDTDYSSKKLTVSVYDENRGSNSTTDYSFAIENIIYGYAYGTNTWLLVKDGGFVVNSYLVSQSVDDIIAQAQSVVSVNELDITLPDGGTSSSVVGDITLHAAVKIDYTLIRGTIVETGYLRLTNIADTAIYRRDENPTLVDAGISFTKSIVGDDITLGYTDTLVNGDDTEIKLVLTQTAL